MQGSRLCLGQNFKQAVHHQNTACNDLALGLGDTKQILSSHLQLERLQYNLLPETAVHAPLRRLVTVCTTAKASPTESQEVKLLTLLTGKIHACPDLVHIFLRSPSSQPDTAVLPNT